MKYGYGKVVFYQDKKREWRWRAVARNGRIIADSGEGYKRLVDASKGWLRLKENHFFVYLPQQL